jgi:hypothetical protein
MLMAVEQGTSGIDIVRYSAAAAVLRLSRITQENGI